MYQRLIAFLLVVLIMVHYIQAAAVDPTTTASDDDFNDLLVRNAKGGIDLGCTTSCTKWWACRVKCFFFCKCDRPVNCDCSKFGWERK